MEPFISSAYTICEFLLDYHHLVLIPISVYNTPVAMRIAPATESAGVILGGIGSA